MTEEFITPIRLKPSMESYPEGMQFTGTWENTAALIDWVEARGGVATWYKPGILTHDTRGRELSEPKWFGERIHVQDAHGFTRFVFLSSWVIINSRGQITTMTDEVKKKAWVNA